MASLEPGLRETIREILDEELRRAYQFAPIPGIITSVDDARSTCTVQPGVRRALPTVGNEEIEYETIPMLQNVQLLIPQTDDTRVKLRVPAGTRCLVFVSAWDMGRWLNAAVRDMPVDPDDPTVTPLESAWAIPLTLASNARSTGTDLHIETPNTVRIQSSVDGPGQGVLVGGVGGHSNLAYLDSVNTTLNFIFNGWLKRYIDTAASTGAPVPPGTPDSWSYASNPISGTIVLRGS